MKFAEISIVRLNSDVITVSGGSAFDFIGCADAECYDSTAPGDPKWSE